MKGLLIKDFCFMLQRRRSFILILVLGMVMSFSQETDFSVGWMIMIGLLFSLSTIAYDEYDNGFPFLMSLPVSRKCYACEKYVFGTICSLSFWLFGILFHAAAAALRGSASGVSGDIAGFFILLLILLLILDISIPFNLKFGSEKGRLYMIIFWGTLFGSGFALIRLMPDWKGTLAAAALSLSPFAAAGAAAFTVALTAASVAWSIRIMNGKEF